jgi:protein-S-isoprenylcysteine O-methyltransferase Ste14
MAERRRPQAADWVASIATFILLIAGLFVERGDDALLKALGVATFLPAIIFMFGPFVHLSRHGEVEEGKSFIHTTAVVDRGLYGIVRHPQYLGYCLLALGFALVSQHLAMLALAVVAVVFFYVQMVREERFLQRELGEPYEAYMERVPRANFFLGLYRHLRANSTNAR